MNTRPVIRTVALGAVLLPLALIATGCSIVDELVHQQKSLDFPDAAALERGWDGQPEWIPVDATDITGTASTTAPDAAILLHSAKDLDPAECVEVSRQSAPIYAVSGAPAVYEMDRVFACGTWSVVRTDDGWLGWTPNHPDEAAASPGS